MKILLLADLSVPHPHRFIRFLKKKGMEVEALSFEESCEDFNYHRISSFSKPKRLKYIAGIPKVRKIVREIKPHILNPHFIPNYGLVSIFTKGRRPMALFVWGSDLLITPKKGWLQRVVTRFILRKADLIVVDANLLKEMIRKEYTLLRKTILVIPYGVEKKLRERPLSKLKENQMRIVSHRRLDPDMNPLTLIEALKIVKEEGFSFEAFIASKGRLERIVRERIRELGLEREVKLTGWLKEEELAKLISSCHIYVSSSISDSTSVSLLEAMALGAFPVVSALPANKEWIKEGENGLLFDPNSPKELAEKLIFLFENRAIIEEGRKINKEIIEKKANWEKNMEELLRVMERLVH